jgi:hypothetical protein
MTFNRRHTNAEKTKKSLTQNLIIVLIMLILMVTFIRYFFKQEQQFSDVAFNALQNAFRAQIILVHSQWLMDKQPRVVKLSVNDRTDKNKIKKILVNNQGWVDIVSNGQINVCEKIWQLVMDRPLALMKMSVGAVLVNKVTTAQVKSDKNIDVSLGNKVRQKTGHKCRYSIDESHYFEYNSATGKVFQSN